MEAAQRAVHRGWSVIPVRASKAPAVSTWTRWQSEAPNASDIQRWQRLDPAGWAVVTGRVSGLFVLDFDGAEGVALHRRLGLPINVRTSRGIHTYVEHTELPWVTTRRALLPHLDVRADGGYAIFAGRGYAMVDPEPLPYDRLPDEIATAHSRPSPAADGLPRIDALALLARAPRTPNLDALRAELETSG